MRAYKYLLILVFSHLLTASFAQSEGIPFVTKFSTKEYGGGIQNWAITQNREGLMYVANNFGLLEYDGTTWKKYSMPNAAKIRDVHVGKNGKIYVASQGDFGYYVPSQKGDLHFHSMADRLPTKTRGFDEAWRLFENGPSLLFCTFQHIFLFEKGGEITTYTPEHLAENFFFIGHTLYIQIPKQGLCQLKSGKIQLMPHGAFMQGKSVTGMVPLNRGLLLVATLDDGMYLYQPSQGFQPWEPEKMKEMQLGGINQLLSLRNGNIAIGTQNQGLFILDREGKLIYHLNKGTGLSSRTILSMYEDVEGNLWLGHNNGISSVELNLPFTLINEETGLPGTGYDGFIDGQDLYLGTNNGVYRNKGNGFEFVTGSDGQVYDLSRLGGKMTIGHHKGAFQLENGALNQISDLLGYWTFLSIDEERVIGGNYKGLALFKQEGNSLKFMHTIEGFEESSRVMELDQEGVIWMTQGYKGVYRIELINDFQKAKVSFYGTEHGLPSNILINVWKVNNELVFTTESGVYRYDAPTDRFVPDEFFGKQLGKEVQISYLEQDLLGNIYYISRQGIGVIEQLPNGAYEHKSTLFNRIRGLLNDDLRNLTALDATTMLFGAKEGFILFDKAKLQTNEVAYSTLIREVTMKDSTLASSYYLKDEMVKIGQKDLQILSYANNSIQFRFSAPFFHRSDEMVYQYKLKGYDKDWSAWTSKTDKEYTNLREGNYEFTVRAKNIYEQLSKPATFQFKVTPPWFRSTWAFIVYGIGVVAALWGFYHLLNMRHEVEKRRMELKQEKKINYMDQELRSSAEELQRLKNEKLESEVKSKNKELALSTMHLLNKNSFINSVKGDINTIVKKSKNQAVQKELNKIVQSINKNIEGDEDWKHFAIHFDQVHGDFTKRLSQEFTSMTPQEMKLSAYLRMNLSTKEIAHLLNISVRGVEIARYRLRKRLNLERSTNLQEFIINY